MLDKEMEDYAGAWTRRLLRAAEEAGYPTQPLDGEAAPFPAFLFWVPSGYQAEDWAVACTAVPLVAGGERLLLTQLYSSITPPFPEGRLPQLRRLIEGRTSGCSSAMCCCSAAG